MTIARADFIEGIAKGMAVLESFDTERQRLNATLAAERAGLTRAAARRHLLTLAHLGYLETDGSYFWMAPKVLRFSGSYLASSRLPRALQPTLNRLAAQTGESFSAVVLDGEEVVIVARSGSYGTPTRVLAYGLHLGARLPAHATSTGRVLLAAMAATQLTQWLKGRHLARLTPHTSPRRARCASASRRCARTTTASPARSTSSACRRWRCAARHAGPHGGGAQRGAVGHALPGRDPAARDAAAAVRGGARGALPPVNEGALNFRHRHGLESPKRTPPCDSCFSKTT